MLFWLNERPEELDEFIVTDKVPHVFDVSQTVMVAPPTAKPETVSELPDRLVETALVFELPDTVYVPLPPEIVTY